MSPKSYGSWNSFSRVFFAKKMTIRQKMTLWLIAGPLIAITASAALFTLRNGAFGQIQFLARSSAASSDRLNPEFSNLAQKDRALGADFDSLFSTNGSAPEIALSNRISVPIARLDSLQPESMVQRFSGIITARRNSRLAAKHSGRVNHVHFDLGDRVESGQTMAELDCRQLIAERDVLLAQLDSVQARLNELRSGPRPQEIEQAEALVRELEATLSLREISFQRTQDLVKSSSVSKQELDESQTAVEASQAQLLSARKSLELLREGTRHEQIEAQEATVRGLKSQIEKLSILIEEHLVIAPFSGHVQARFVDEGVIVSPGEPIVEVIESDSLEVHVGFPSNILDSTTLGSAKILCGNRHMEARLLRVAPSVDQRTRNLEVVFGLPKSAQATFASLSNAQDNYTAVCDWRHRIGEAVDVQVTIPVEGTGWWVPSSALVPAARGLWSVMIAKPQSFAGTASSTPNLDSRSGESGRTDDGGRSGGSEGIAADPAAFELDSEAVHLATVRQVELLRSTGDWSQVQGPLDGWDLVILSGLHRLTAGQQVQCMPAEMGIHPSVPPIVSE